MSTMAMSCTEEVLSRTVMDWLETTDFRADAHHCRILDIPALPFCLELHLSSSYIPAYGGFAPSIRCVSVFIPEGLRRQGLFSAIVQRLIKRAEHARRVFLIGPIFNEDLPAILARRGFKPRGIWDMYFDNARYKIRKIDANQ